MNQTSTSHHQKSAHLLAAGVAAALLTFTAGAGVTAAGADRSANGRHSRPDLRDGAVFSMSNAVAGNSVVAFHRADDGTLTPAGSFPTGGTGSGGFEDSANGLVLGSANGESAPNNFIDSAKLLFATNAGSDNISVFRVKRDGLKLVDVEPSNGMKPVSITVHDGVAYVLNNGETVDGLVPPNCVEGAFPSITGFTVSKSGNLTPIPGSTRMLSGDKFSGCAQVSFNPKGTVLVVTERTAHTEGQVPGDEGVINTYVVNDDGTLGEQQVFDATGQGPFGFTFTKSGALLTTEQFDGTEGPGLGAAAGYDVGDDGSLTPSSPSVHNGGTDTCWFVVTDDGTLGFTTSFFGGGRISSYAVGPRGSLDLLIPDADPDVHDGASDLSLSEDSRYLYQLNSLEGTISGFKVGANGSLRRIDTEQAHAPSSMAAPMGLAST